MFTLNGLMNALIPYQLKMRVQKRINNEEYLQLARSEGYSFTEDELNEAKEWIKTFE